MDDELNACCCGGCNAAVAPRAGAKEENGLDGKDAVDGGANMDGVLLDVDVEGANMDGVLAAGVRVLVELSNAAHSLDGDATAGVDVMFIPPNRSNISAVPVAVVVLACVGAITLLRVPLDAGGGAIEVRWLVGERSGGDDGLEVGRDVDAAVAGMNAESKMDPTRCEHGQSTSTRTRRIHTMHTRIAV